MTYFQNLSNIRTDLLYTKYRSAPCVSKPDSRTSGYHSNAGISFMPHQDSCLKHHPEIPPRRPRYNVSVVSDVTSNSYGTLDDDDDKTTTSGSYTIDQESLYTSEVQLHMPLDCIV